MVVYENQPILKGMAIVASTEKPKQKTSSRRGLLSRVQGVLASEKNTPYVPSAKKTKKSKRGRHSLLKQALNILYKEEILNKPENRENALPHKQAGASLDSSENITASRESSKKDAEILKSDSPKNLSEASLAQAIDSLQKVLSQFMAPYLNPEVLKEIAKKMPTPEPASKEADESSSTLPTPFDNSVPPMSSPDLPSDFSPSLSQGGEPTSASGGSNNFSPESSQKSTPNLPSDFPPNLSQRGEPTSASGGSNNFSPEFSPKSSPNLPSDFSPNLSPNLSQEGEPTSASGGSSSAMPEGKLFDQFAASLPPVTQENFPPPTQEQTQRQTNPQDIFAEKKFDQFGTPHGSGGVQGGYPPPLQPAYSQEAISPQGYLSRAQSIAPFGSGGGFPQSFAGDGFSSLGEDMSANTFPPLPPPQNPQVPPPASPIEQPLYPPDEPTDEQAQQTGNVLNNPQVPSLDMPQASPSAFPQEEQVQEIKGVLELKPPELEDAPYLTLTYDFKNIPHDFPLAKDHNILEYAYYKYKPMLLKAQNFVKHKQIAHGLNYYRTIREQKIPEELKKMIDRNIQDINDFLYKYLMSGVDEEH